MTSPQNPREPLSGSRKTKDKDVLYFCKIFKTKKEVK